jgi:isopenicillin-N epimerase
MTSPTPDLARLWTLEPELVFLNHGSFGACPRPVLEEQARLRAQLERQPVEFFVRRLPDLLDAARERLARFLGADPGDLVWVPNATHGVNAVLRSLDFAPGDELLTTDHEYGASRNALAFVAERAGARRVTASVPFPLRSSDEAVEAVLAAVTAKTRLVLVDHVTSQTGLVLPLERLLPELAGRGVDVLVDGAHAPGMLPLDLAALAEAGAVYYTGNCHKWLCAPKGAGFLHVRRDRRDAVRPLAISHGAALRRPGRSRFHDEFDWTGTADPTPLLAVPAALDLLGSLLPGGFEEVRRRNRGLVLAGRRVVCEALGVEPPAPEEMIGSLASLPLPDGSPEPPTSPLYTDPLQEELLGRYRIEVPVIPWPAPPKRLLRLSAQLYNREEHYRRLAAALGEVL